MIAMRLVKPPRLKEGDTLLIVAPASSMDPLTEDAVQRGMTALEALGLRVEISPYAYWRYGHTAGPAEERAGVLMGAFEDPGVDGVMAVWGGFNSNDLIEYLDYRTIRMHPKVFIGYSDITILNTVFYVKAGLVSFHGPAFVTMTHPFLMDYEVEEFRRIIMDGEGPHTVRASPSFIDDPYYYRHPERLPEERQNPGWDVIKPGTAEGRLIGGNLGTFLALAGTEYWPDLEGAMLFVEDDEEESTASVARYFRQLRHIGVFDKVAGLMIGRFPQVVGFKEEDSLRMIVKKCTQGYDFPIVAEMDFGHTNPIMTIPVGIKARLDAEKKELTYLEAGVL